MCDPVKLTLDRMTDAEHALHEAVADIPVEVRKRLDTSEELSDEDRESIIQIVPKSLARFQPRPETESKPESQREGLPN